MAEHEMPAHRMWMAGARMSMERKGTTGAMTRQAKRAGYRKAMPYARAVLKGDVAMPRGKAARRRLRRRAQFAVNAAG